MEDLWGSKGLTRTPPPPRYRIEFRRPGLPAVPLGDVLASMRKSARAFDDELCRFVRAGERDTLSLVCEVGGHDEPFVTRRVAPGTAD